MKLQADRDVCCGAGMCVLNDPAVFDQDDDGLVTLLDADPGPLHHTRVRAAIEQCPSGALSLIED